jgi:U3 small nucleolar ribonucleoprotein component
MTLTKEKLDTQITRAEKKLAHYREWPDTGEMGGGKRTLIAAMEADLELLRIARCFVDVTAEDVERSVEGGASYERIRIALGALAQLRRGSL